MTADRAPSAQRQPAAGRVAGAPGADAPRGSRRPLCELIGLERSADDGSAGLVRRVQRGDHLAATLLYRRHVARVRRYVAVLLKDVHEADEVTQQVFVTVFERIGSYRDDGQRFESWLFRIARNAAWKHLRRHRRSAPTDPDTLRHDMDQIAARAAHQPETTTTSFLSVIGRLPLGQQRALLLAFAFDLSSDEAGEVLRQNAAAVRQSQRRAIAALESGVKRLGI